MQTSPKGRRWNVPSSAAMRTTCFHEQQVNMARVTVQSRCVCVRACVLACVHMHDTDGHAPFLWRLADRKTQPAPQRIALRRCRSRRMPTGRAWPPSRPQTSMHWRPSLLWTPMQSQSHIATANPTSCTVPLERRFQGRPVVCAQIVDRVPGVGLILQHHGLSGTGLSGTGLSGKGPSGTGLTNQACGR